MSASWNLPPPPGFRGFRDDMPVTAYNSHLPHWRQEGASYFVTFRLADSLPQSKLHELEHIKAEGEQHRRPRKEQSREAIRRIEAWLDQGMGSCLLRDSDAAETVIAAMLGDDGAAYELGCYVVMPNHVHAIVRPLARVTLETILGRWKGRSSYEINRQFRRSGVLWQRESFDRVIRDEEHLWRIVQYIGNNPRRAGLPLVDVPRWIRPEWEERGWRFEE